MSLQQLKYIVALDDHRHFAKAADACMVAQPTLTLQVQKFEHQLGVALFDRRTKPMSPTRIGGPVIQKAREVLKNVEELYEIVNSEHQSMEGQFRMGIIPTLAPYLLPRFISKFMQEHDGVQMEIEEKTSLEIIDALKQGRLDLGILATPLGEDLLREIPLFLEPFIVFANQNHSILKGSGPLNAEELNSQDLWLLGDTHCVRHQALQICGHRSSARPRNLSMEAGSIETLKRMIKNASGFTLIPELSIDGLQDSAFTREIGAIGNRPTRQVSLVVRRGFIREKLINELSIAIQSTIPESYLMEADDSVVSWRK